MQRTKSSLYHAFWLLGLTACRSGEDPQARPDPVPDAATAGALDAGASTPEAGQIVPTEAGPPPFSEAGQGAACSKDSDCGAGGLCLASACLFGCEAEEGCELADLGAELDLGSPTQLISDGKSTVYYITGFKVGTMTDWIGEAKLWKLRLGSQPVALNANIGEFPQLLFATDEHVYYRFGRASYEQTLQRVSALDGSQETITDRAGSAWLSNAWLTSENVWWSTQSMTGYKLWKSPRSGALSAIRVAESTEHSWGAGTEQWLVHRLIGKTFPEPLFVEMLSDQSPRTLGQVPVAAKNLGADEHAAYGCAGGGKCIRFYYDMRAEPAQLTPDLVNKVELPSSGWVYWSSSLNQPDYPVILGRSHRDRPAQRSELLRLPQVDDFTAFPSALVYRVQGRLFVKATPPPCDATLACPSGLTCSSSTCQ